MIRIHIAQATIRNLKGVSKSSGKAYDMNFQTAYAYTQDRDGNTPPFPEKFEITLPSDLPHGYAPGDYTLQPSAIYVDRDGKLAVVPRLVPVKAKASSSSASTL
jgi:hypothetical protein